jgi:hypothetical protein
MKTFFSIIGVGAVLFFALLVYAGGCENNGVTREEFQRSHNYLNQRIDTVQIKLNEIEFLANRIDVRTEIMDGDIKSIKGSIDTLKLGQNILYNAVTNEQGRGNWANQLLKLF